MSDATNTEPCSCCITDWLLPREWFESINQAAERAVADRNGEPIPFAASQAPAVFAGTKYVQKPGLEGFWRSDLLWPNSSTLKVAFRGGWSGLAEKVLGYAREWCQHANLKFEQTADFASGHIRVSFAGPGYSSRLGKQSVDPRVVPLTEPSMLLGFTQGRESDAEIRRLALHEFGHAIGLEHEHMHPKAGIRWNEDALYNYLRPLLPPMPREHVLAQVKLVNTGREQWSETAYDVKSIMRYRFPREVFSTGWDPAFDVENMVLSDGDKKCVQEMYPGPGVTSGGGEFEKQEKIKVGEPAKGSIRQGKKHRYDFTVQSGIYEITTEGPAVVRVELMTKEGKPPANISVTVEDAISSRVGAYLQPYFGTDGEFYVVVRSSPFSPGTLGEGDYTLKVVKTS